MSIKVDLQNLAGKKSHIPSKKKFLNWSQEALQFVPKKSGLSELCIRIVNKRESARLNEKYRHKKGPTNVLSFSYRENTSLFGDLAICADLVKHEASSQQKKTEAHWAHLTVHGILHVLGYDHVKLRDAEKMELLETKILMKLGYPNPYFEEAESALDD